MIVLYSLHVFFTLIGVFTVYHWLRPQKKPADTSNRINAIKLWWLGLTAEEYFADRPGFEWLKEDVRDQLDILENVRKK